MRLSHARSRCAWGGKPITASLQIEPDRRHRDLADRQITRLASLPFDSQLLIVVVDVRDPERYELLGAQPTRVGELEQRAIALNE